MYTPIDITEFFSTMTPSTTSERAPIKQLSSIMVGLACNGSSTPPMPTPPDRCTFLPICAQEPTVAHVSTMVPSSTYAPRFTKDGIKTTPGAINADLRTTQIGTARNPAAFHWFSSQPTNLLSTLSHQPLP